MSSRSEVSQSKRKGVYWLTRTYYPRPHSDMEATTDYLLPLYEHERGLDKGRFARFSPEPLGEGCIVDLSGAACEAERVHFIELIMEWLADQECDWHMTIPAWDKLALDVSLSDPEAAFVFDLRYGGDVTETLRVG